jgi:hypothetical protein
LPDHVTDPIPPPGPGAEGATIVRRVLHVAPDPRGGWLVEAEDHRINPSSYEDLESARQEAQSYAAAHGWRVVVHDEVRPAAADPGPAGLE